MTLRDRLFVLAGLQILGDGFERVAGLLPEERRSLVLAEANKFSPDQRAQIPGRLMKLQQRHAVRVNRIARRRWGAAWGQLDPRIAQTVLLHGWNQDH